MKALAVDAHDSLRLFAGTDDVSENLNITGGVFQSGNGGQSWALVHAPYRVNALAVDPTTSGGTLTVYCTVLSGGTGTFQSTDGGNSWNDIGDIEMNAPMWSLSFDAAGSVLYAGGGEGIWSIKRPCHVWCDAFVPASGVAGTPVAFPCKIQESCEGAPAFLWAFGDGQASMEQNPDHEYAAAGDYQWTLTVAADGQTCTRTGTITIIPPCTVTCTAAAPSNVPAGAPVTFHAAATPHYCTGTPVFAWDFGDGFYSNVQDPCHLYADPGTFAWVVTIHAGGATCTQGGTIAVTPAPLPGDCNGDGTVSIGEIQKAVNMFLGIEPVGCGVDCDNDGTISIGEVQKVINAFWGIAVSCGECPGRTSGPVPALTLGSVSAAGSLVRVPVVMTGDQGGVFSAEARVTYDAARLALDTQSGYPNGVELAPAVSALGYSGLSSQPAPGSVRFGLIHQTQNPHAPASNPLQGGADGVLAYLRFLVLSGAAGTVPLGNACGAYDGDGDGLATACSPGAVLLPDPCSLACTVSASPSSGEAPLAVQFTAAAVASNCTGMPTYFWNFGDGSASSVQNPSHTYVRGGEYAWSFTATVDGHSCWQNGAVTVTYPPGTYTISGKVTENGSGLPGVLLTIPGLAQTATTRSDEPYVGQYAFTGLGNGTYRVTPSKTCKRFTPLFLDVTVAGSSQANKNFSTARVSLCTPCYDALDRDMSLCGGLWDPATCTRQAQARFSNCLHQATVQANSSLYAATLLAISVSRHGGQPTPESVSLTIAEEGDYYINVVNGDQVNRDTMASSATVDLSPGGRVFYPEEIKWRDPFLVKSVHLTPGEYTLVVEVRSSPGAYISVVVSNLDFGTLPFEGE